jgi:hypothetical protein
MGVGRQGTPGQGQRQADREDGGLFCGCIIPVIIALVAGVALAVMR